ncbi:Mitochondrial import inner membrane translocase subunit Tim54 [Penicillium brevicompactum]|uniref:Mitochondrial import inner membrane translocase subunit TIM54 n=1 Tax=Penicillium brevicompactum TaxID=5074 RepID=A0A9W9UPL1_PENBR|nr:Mitochondrial import inner membrane translocase subunit Tim54 [Penicillium brevicompactum]
MAPEHRDNFLSITPDASSSAAPAGTSKPPVAEKPPNPVFRMMGLPNMRFKLPSRNWMIFLTITGSFTGAIMYDRKEKRRVQKKWSELVAHLSKESLETTQMRRKLTEYVKPILVAAALDYTVVEGRREGDVRAGTAENIRKLRRKAGEPSSTVEEMGVEAVVAATREQIGITDEPGPKGDLVIGRHTWKEYVRGLHEGWLGPLDAPPPPPEEAPIVVDALDTPEAPVAEVAPIADPTPEATTPEISTIESLESSLDSDNKDDTPDPKAEQAKAEEAKKAEEEAEKEKKPAGPTPAYIFPADYSSASLPPSLPQNFDSSAPVDFPHILGFLNTPIRMYRFLTQRHLAENVGREVAAVVLAANSRPYRDDTFSADSEITGASVDSTPSPDGSFTDLAPRNHEQQTVLDAAEKEWHKSVRKREEDGKEREWLDDVVLDQRIASRMRRALLSPEDEARSQRIGELQEYILGEERPAHVPFWKRMWIDYGYGESEEAIRRKPILGNLDGEDGQ